LQTLGKIEAPGHTLGEVDGIALQFHIPAVAEEPGFCGDSTESLRALGPATEGVVLVGCAVASVVVGGGDELVVDVPVEGGRGKDTR